MTATSFRRSAGAVVASILLATALGRAQDKDTLWTKVTAEGKAILLSWDKNHPWDQMLGAQGAELMATYFTGNREVSESLGRAAAAKGDARTLRFTLPENVRATVSGPICLFLQAPNRRALPVRRASAGDADTVGFRYEAWERSIRQVSDVALARSRVADATRSLDTATRRVASKQSSMAQRGWSDQASCQQVAAPSSVLGPKPFDVIEPAGQQDAARRVCINRVVTGFIVNQIYIEDLPKSLADLAAAKNVERARAKISAVYSSAFAGPAEVNPRELVGAIAQRLGADNATLKARQPQIATFDRDWMKWAGTLKDYTPPLGTPDDDLGWVSTARESAFRLFGPDLAKKLNASWAMEDVPAGTIRDLESFLGSALDAYGGCVDDAAKQLATKYENYQALRSTAPQRAEAARDFLVRECRQEVSDFEKMKADRKIIEDELARDQQALARASTPAPLATSPVVLNAISCQQAKR
jgi:hypothetical protein